MQMYMNKVKKQNNSFFIFQPEIYPHQKPITYLQILQNNFVFAFFTE